MADYEAKIAPIINEEFIITSVFAEQPRNHKGLDISTGKNSNIYSMSNGIVLRADLSSSYGNVIIIKNESNVGFLYAHLDSIKENLKVGDTVKTGDLIGVEGTTGQSTGIHLHIEMQNVINNTWNYNLDLSDYLNPAEFMKIPNEQGISAIYYGIPIPPMPTKKKKSKFKWVLYARKLRNKRKII